jgi:hypothetical protein
METSKCMSQGLLWSLALKSFDQVYKHQSNVLIHSKIVKIGISDFPDLKQTRWARKIPITVLETTLITKESTYTLDFRKWFVVSFWSHSIRGIFSAFGRFIEDYLRSLTFHTIFLWTVDLKKFIISDFLEHFRLI